MQDEMEANAARAFILQLSSFILPLTLFVAWGAGHLDGFSWDYDEGIHVYIAWLVQNGHPLYAQTFSPYTPGFIVALVAAFNWFGASVTVGRIVALLCATLGILGVMLMARELVPSHARGGGLERGLFAALAAALLLALTPAFLQWSRAAMSDLPAVALMSLAVACALACLRTQQLRWLFVAEVIGACALWIKLIAIGGAIALAAVVLLALRERAGRKRVLVGTLLIALVALAPLLFFDVRALLEQAIYFHIEKRAAYNQSLEEKIFILADFLGANATLTVLAALGAVTSLFNRVTRHPSLVTLAWFVATFVSLLAQTPLFANHHPVALVLPLAALVGAGVGFTTNQLRLAITYVAPPFTRSPVRPFRLSLALACLSIAILGSNGLDERLRAALAPPSQPAAEEAITLLDALTPSDEVIVSDAQMIAFRAQRQSPPALSDTSQARIVSGNLTASQLITAAQSANAILFWSGRLESLAPFVEWTERNYHAVRTSLQSPNAPYRLLLREAHPQHALDARFGTSIHLLGYDLNRRSASAIHAAQSLALTFYFERTGTIEHAYTIFVHLLGVGGQVIAQQDRPPLAERYPTDQWRMNEFVVDEFVLPLDAEIAEGDYAIELGLYQRETLQRAPAFVSDARQSDDRVLLAPVRILPRVR